MAITYFETKNQEWEDFKTNGGSITFEIDPEDISSTRDFETHTSIQPILTAGFELPPTSLINTLDLQTLINVYGSHWDDILCSVYLSGGNVIYKKKSQMANMKLLATYWYDVIFLFVVNSNIFRYPYYLKHSIN